MHNSAWSASIAIMVVPSCDTRADVSHSDPVAGLGPVGLHRGVRFHAFNQRPGSDYSRLRKWSPSDSPVGAVEASACAAVEGAAQFLAFDAERSSPGLVGLSSS